MKRQEGRETTRQIYKNIKRMSIGQLEKTLVNIESEAEKRVIEVFKEVLHKEMKIGNKRFTKLLYEITKKMEE